MSMIHLISILIGFHYISIEGRVLMMTQVKSN